MNEAPPVTIAPLVRRHMLFGWCALLVFVTLGTTLEVLHALKAAAYLGVGNETRRLMWTLAHAHGIGLSILHIAYAATLRALFDAPTGGLGFASQGLSWASVLVPGGFFLGGIVTYGGDPGVGVFLVPLGAAVLFVAVALVAYEIVRTRTG
jgi:hypothetical protein